MLYVIYVCNKRLLCVRANSVYSFIIRALWNDTSTLNLSGIFETSCASYTSSCDKGGVENLSSLNHSRTQKYHFNNISTTNICQTVINVCNINYRIFNTVFFCPFVGAFTKLRKANISFVMSVCPTVRMEQLGSHWTDFREIWCLSIFRKSVKKIQVSLKSDKNNGRFTWTPIYIFDHISLSFSQNRKRFRQKAKRKSNTRFMLYNGFFFENRTVYEIMWKM